MWNPSLTVSSSSFGIPVREFDDLTTRRVGWSSKARPHGYCSSCSKNIVVLTIQAPHVTAPGWRCLPSFRLSIGNPRRIAEGWNYRRIRLIAARQARSATPGSGTQDSQRAEGSSARPLVHTCPKPTTNASQLNLLGRLRMPRRQAVRARVRPPKSQGRFPQASQEAPQQAWLPLLPAGATRGWEWAPESAHTGSGRRRACRALLKLLLVVPGIGPEPRSVVERVSRV